MEPSSAQEFSTNYEGEQKDNIIIILQKTKMSLMKRASIFLNVAFFLFFLNLHTSAYWYKNIDMENPIIKFVNFKNILYNRNLYTKQGRNVLVLGIIWVCETLHLTHDSNA